MRSRVVPVPVDVAVAYTAERGWHAVAAPPAWWLDQQETELLEDIERLRRMTVEARSAQAPAAARARWARVGDRSAATARARAALASLPVEERTVLARRAGLASGAARRDRRTA